MITVLIWFDKHKAQFAARCHYVFLQNMLSGVCVQGFTINSQHPYCENRIFKTHFQLQCKTSIWVQTHWCCSVSREIWVFEQWCKEESIWQHRIADDANRPFLFINHAGRTSSSCALSVKSPSVRTVSKVCKSRHVYIIHHGILQDYLVRHAETDKTSRMLIHWSVAGTPAPIYATCWTRLAASVSWSTPHSANSVLHQVVLVLDAACGEPMSDLSGGDGGARPIGSAEGIRTVFLLLETGVQPVQFSIAQQPELHGASWMRILPGS